MKNLLIVLSLMCSLCLQAKGGKIKYGKYVIYEGGIENKQPHGQGVLKMLNPVTKGVNDFEISGQFDGNNVLNARIISSHFPTLENISHLNIKYGGDKGKCMDVDVNMNNSTLASYLTNSSIIEVDQFCLHLILPNNASRWTVIAPSEVRASYPPKTLSEILTKLQYNHEMVEKAVEICKVAKEGLLSISHPAYIMKDGTIIQNNKITYANKDAVRVNKDMWLGTRTLLDGTKIYSDGDKFKIDYPNGDSYLGTIKEDVFYPLYANVNEPTFTFYTGTQKANEVTTKWIKGETMEDLRKRLNNVLGEKWFAMIENGTLSEEDAIKRQKEENDSIAEEKAREEKEKERIELCAKILRDKWKCKQILFTGKLRASSEGDNIFKLFWGIDHTYFSGTTTLTLDESGHGSFELKVQPSVVALSEGRHRFGQVNGFGNTIMSQANKKGEWYFEGNTLFIDGTKVGILSNNGQTFTYEGMLGATMTISKRTQ